jgi:hypothetical protein
MVEILCFDEKIEKFPKRKLKQASNHFLQMIPKVDTKRNFPLTILEDKSCSTILCQSYTCSLVKKSLRFLDST